MSRISFLISLVMCGGAMANDEAPLNVVEKMELADGKLVGAGADLILERLPNAQFILIGEDHGFADSSEIALALAKASRPFGVVNHVVEEGPLIEDWASEKLRHGGVPALAEALNGRPLSLAFLSKSEDAKLADYFIKNAPQGRDSLWGVDQEFIVSTFVHLERLVEIARTTAAKELAAHALEVEKKSFAELNFGAMFLSAMTRQKFDELLAAFKGNEEATTIIEGLQESATIYQSYNEGRNFASNTDRIALMRKQFLENYRSRKTKAPRALFKFGAIHLGKGTTPLNTFDHGSLTEGIAAANGLETLRILFIPLAGRQLAFSPSPEGVTKIEDYRSNEVAALLGAIGVDETEITETGYCVVSFEPVRRRLEAKGLSELTPELKYYVLGYDFLVTTRGARPATMLAR